MGYHLTLGEIPFGILSNGTMVTLPWAIILDLEEYLLDYFQIERNMIVDADVRSE